MAYSAHTVYGETFIATQSAINPVDVNLVEVVTNGTQAWGVADNGMVYISPLSGMSSSTWVTADIDGTALQSEINSLSTENSEQGSELDVLNSQVASVVADYVGESEVVEIADSLIASNSTLQAGIDEAQDSEIEAGIDSLASVNSLQDDSLNSLDTEVSAVSESTSTAQATADSANSLATAVSNTAVTYVD